MFLCMYLCICICTCICMYVLVIRPNELCIEIYPVSSIGRGDEEAEI